MSLVHLMMFPFPRTVVATLYELWPNYAVVGLSQLLEPGLRLGRVIACWLDDGW